MASPRPVTLALFPNTVGFGYACVESQRELAGYGVTRVRPLCNGSLLRRMRRQIDYFLPSVVVLQDTDAAHSRQGDRVRSLIDETAAYARSKGLPVYSYSRSQIRDVFEAWEARSKHEIVRKLTDWFPELAHRVPRERKLWMPEGHNMGIFDALSLAVTHAYLAE